MTTCAHFLLPRRAGEKVPQADEGALIAAGTTPHPPAAPSPRKRGEGVWNWEPTE
jgi:hypothetical protein